MGALLAGTQARERLNAGGVSRICAMVCRQTMSDEGSAFDPQAFEKA